VPGLPLSLVADLLDVVRDLAAVGDPASFPTVALNSVDGLVPADISTYNEVDPTTGTTWAARPDSFVASPAQVAVFDAHQEEHPLISFMQRTGDGSARRISDVLSNDTFRRGVLYREFYGPLGIEYQMAVALAMPTPTIVAIALNRGSTDFSDRERRTLDTLRPHLVQAWQQARNGARLSRLLATAVDVVSALGTRVLLLGSEMEELTPGTAVTLYRYFGRPSRDHPLPPRVATWVYSERTRLAGPHPPSLSRALHAQRDGGQLTLRYLAAAKAHPEALLMTETDAAQSDDRPVPFGITRRESEILNLAATGATNASIGTALHISAGTVKKHLDNIYRKLGVRSRVEAIAFLANTPQIGSGWS
jgi:DNA-binding CsgD family transcriptional regulator